MQVTINGIDTRYVLSNEGGGPWLTFIHQLGGDLSVWDQLAGYFRDDYTVLRYDLRGHGETAVSTDSFRIERSLRRSRRVARHARRAVARMWSACRSAEWSRSSSRSTMPSRVDTLDRCRRAGLHFAEETRADIRATRGIRARTRDMASIVEATLERWLTAEFRPRIPKSVEQIRGDDRAYAARRLRTRVRGAARFRCAQQAGQHLWRSPRWSWQASTTRARRLLLRR